MLHLENHTVIRSSINRLGGPDLRWRKGDESGLTLLQGPDNAIQSRYFGHYLTPSRGKFNRTNTTAGSSTSWPKSLRRLLRSLGYLTEIVAHAILKGVKRGTEAGAT